MVVAVAVVGGLSPKGRVSRKSIRVRHKIIIPAKSLEMVRVKSLASAVAARKEVADQREWLPDNLLQGQNK